MKKQLIAIGAVAAIAVTMTGALTACGGNDKPNDGSYIFKAVEREAGSGTRDAFNELVAKGGKSIKAALEEGAQTAQYVSRSNSTAAVIEAVAQKFDTIGYISLGSYAKNTDKVDAVKVEGVEATAANVLNGTYSLARPFNLLYTSYDALSDVAKNFIGFVESTEGQAIIAEEGYICSPDLQVNDYEPYGGSGSLKFSGSTSIAPLVKVLVEEYKKVNPNVTVEVGEGGSGQGVSDAMSGAVDFGMASRGLKASEATSLTARKIADDGIAVVVKKGSKCTAVTFEQLYDLYLNGTAIETK